MTTGADRTASARLLWNTVFLSEDAFMRRAVGHLAADVGLGQYLVARSGIADGDARDRHHAAAILRRASLCAGDVDLIVLSRLLSLAGLAPHAGIPGDPWAATR